MTLLHADCHHVRKVEVSQFFRRLTALELRLHLGFRRLQALQFCSRVVHRLGQQLLLLFQQDRVRRVHLQKALDVLQGGLRGIDQLRLVPLALLHQAALQLLDAVRPVGVQLHRPAGGHPGLAEGVLVPVEGVVVGLDVPVLLEGRRHAGALRELFHHHVLFLRSLSFKQLLLQKKRPGRCPTSRKSSAARRCRSQSIH